MKAKIMAVMTALAIALIGVVATTSAMSADGGELKHYVLLTDSDSNEFCVAFKLESGGDSDSTSQVGSLGIALAERDKCGPPEVPVVAEVIEPVEVPVCEPTLPRAYQQTMVVYGISQRVDQDMNGGFVGWYNAAPRVVVLPGMDAVPSVGCPPVS